MIALAFSSVMARESEAIGLLLDLDGDQFALVILGPVQSDVVFVLVGKPCLEPLLDCILVLVVAIDGDNISLILDQIGKGFVFDVAGLQDDRAGQFS